MHVLVTSFQFNADIDAVLMLDLKRKMLGCIVRVLHCGYAFEVLDTMSTLLAGADRALCRYFVKLLVNSLEAPYSPHFLKAYIDFLRYCVRLKRFFFFFSSEFNPF
jgi:hypothetical protein